MPRASPLKVFRTPIGFHDAYVAASSQKAAMAAWGSDGDLFARGEAELVTDPTLTAEPLASPGKVVKRLRGTAAEQIAALPPDRPRRAPEPKKDASGRHARAQPAAVPEKAPAPRPSRASLDQAEDAIAAAEARHAAARKDLTARERALAEERRKMEAGQATEMEKLETARHRANEHHEAELREWRRQA